MKAPVFYYFLHEKQPLAAPRIIVTAAGASQWPVENLYQETAARA